MSAHMIQGIKPFKRERFYTNCYIPCLLNCIEYLIQNGVDDVITFLSFSYQYMIRDDQSRFYKILSIDMMQFEKNLKDYLEEGGIRFITCRNENSYMDFIKRCVDLHMPVISILDQFYDTNSVNYRKEKNFFHDLVITGYSDELELIYYYDYWIGEEGMGRSLSYELFQRGVDCYLAAGTTDNIKYFIANEERAAGRPKSFTENKKSLLLKMTEFYYKNRVESDLLDTYIHYLYDQMGNIVKNRDSFLMDLFYSVGLELTGFKGLDEYVMINNDEPISPYIVDAFSDICRKYKALYYTLLKARYSNKNKDLEKGIELLKKIDVNEAEFYNMLRNYKNGEGDV